MKIEKFRIKNYKSIIDSGDCYLTNDVTILAGKNESGKTSILEALRDFDTNLEINENAKPIQDESAVPEISITFEIRKSQLQEICEAIGLKKQISNNASIEIIKTFPKQFSISEQSKKEIESENIILQFLEEIGSAFKLKGFQKEKKFIEEIKKHIPHFIFFNSFNDVLPNKISFAELGTNKLINDLSTISNLNFNTIQGPSDRNKEKHRDDINIALNKDYKKFWTQDIISNLSVIWDSSNLYFWIKEDGHTYEPKIRSKGRQWHLAFYIKVTARAKESISNIILIDEPGLFLHAQAQKDILKILEDSAKEVQLIFSTHSPYLLEPERLDRIKLIHRTNEEGTKITNKVHALADKETLTPILTAIGCGLNSGITNVEKINNVVVEGISDLYYLTAFKKILEQIK